MILKVIRSSRDTVYIAHVSAFELKTTEIYFEKSGASEALKIDLAAGDIIKVCDGDMMIFNGKICKGSELFIEKSRNWDDDGLCRGLEDGL